MQRPTLLLLFFLPAMLHTQAQSIDSLQTDRQVLAFVNDLYTEDGTLCIGAPKPTIDSYCDSIGLSMFPASAYYKTDFDHNGNMDLLFNGAPTTLSP